MREYKIIITQKLEYKRNVLKNDSIAVDIYKLVEISFKRTNFTKVTAHYAEKFSRKAIAAPKVCFFVEYKKVVFGS